MMDEQTRARGRATIYELHFTHGAVYRWLIRHCKPGDAAGQAAVRALNALADAESAARTFPIDPTGL
jgi:hypothetical protein